MKWNYNAAMAAANGEFVALSEQGLQFIATGALAFMAGAYWDTDKRKVSEVADEIRSLCEASGKGRTQGHFYAQTCLMLARHLAKQFGTGIATDDPNGKGDTVNPFWTPIMDAATPREAVPYVLTYIKGTLKARNVQNVHDALAAPKAGKKDETNFADKVLKAAEKALENGDITFDDIKVTIAKLQALLMAASAPAPAPAPVALAA